MAEQTADAGPGTEPPDLPADDAGRLNNASSARLIAILVALVLFSEIAPFQLGMITSIVPKIGASFPAAGNSATWTVTILGVAGGATMALTGKAADLWGKKRITLVTGLLFLIGCLICALTSNWALFLVGRGIGAVSWGMTAIEYGLLRDLMPRRWIPICVGILGTGFGISAVAGPLITGALTDHYSWRSIFWFLVIYMAVVIPIFWLIVPETPLRVRQKFDVVGAVLFGAGVGAVLIYISQGSSWGWHDIGCLAYLIGGVVGLLAFVAWEIRTPHPMMELSLLRAPRVSILMAISFFVTGILSLANLIVSYMFLTPPAAQIQSAATQTVAQQAAALTHNPVPPAFLAPFVHVLGDLSYGKGYSILQLAVHVSIWLSLFGMVFGPIGGYLARRIGGRLPLVIGTVSLVAAFALWVPWHTTWQQQVSVGVLFGLGFGFFYAATPNLLMDAVPVERQGISAGMLAVFGGIGTSVTTALYSSIQAAHPAHLEVSVPGLPKTVAPIPQVYTDSAYSQSYLLVGLIAAAAAFLLALALRTGRTPARGGEGLTTGEAVTA